MAATFLFHVFLFSMHLCAATELHRQTASEQSCLIGSQFKNKGNQSESPPMGISPKSNEPAALQDILSPPGPTNPPSLATALIINGVESAEPELRSGEHKHDDEWPAGKGPGSSDTTGGEALSDDPVQGQPPIEVWKMPPEESKGGGKAKGKGGKSTGKKNKNKEKQKNGGKKH